MYKGTEVGHTWLMVGSGSSSRAVAQQAKGWGTKMRLTEQPWADCADCGVACGFFRGDGEPWKGCNG